ncbi:MAG: hypothetical protein ABIO70_18680 [Pseudomonadota bacterium]
MSVRSSTLRFSTLALLAFLVAAPAFAGDVEDAEHIRLTEEMRRLSKRNAWKGVETAYVELEALQKRGVELSYEDHWLGAQAARALGDINGVYMRLKAAAKVDGSQEVIEWLSDLDAHYGQVDLSSKRKEAVALSAAAMPFAPDQRAAIEAAVAAVGAGQAYKGLLPAGSYTFGDETVTVTAACEPVVVALVDERPPKEEREPFKLAYIGPRVNVGPAFTSAGEPAEVSWKADQVQPGGFSGMGARAGIGLEAGLGKHLGVLVEVGYHGGFGAAPETEAGFEAAGSKINAGYGWLAAEYRVGRLWLDLGPVWSVGSAFTSDELSDGGGLVGVDGVVRAGGAAGGAAFALTQVGNLSAAVSLLGGAQSDMSRLYTWGLLGFTLAPASPRSE